MVRIHTTVLCVLALFMSAASGSEPKACLKAAAKYHKVDYLLLVAIAQVESGMNPKAMNTNSNGTADRGLMQINDWWIPRLSLYGVSPNDLRDPCVSAFVGAWILAHEISRHGYTWKAVGAYNSPSEKQQKIYVGKVQQRLAVLRKTNLR